MAVRRRIENARCFAAGLLVMEEGAPATPVRAGLAEAAARAFDSLIRIVWSRALLPEIAPPASLSDYGVLLPLRHGVPRAFPFRRGGWKKRSQPRARFGYALK